MRGIRTAIGVALVTAVVASLTATAGRSAGAEEGAPHSGADAMGYEDAARFAADASAWIRSFCEDRGLEEARCEVGSFEEALRDLSFGLSRDRARTHLARCAFGNLIGQKGDWAEQVAATERCYMQRMLKEWR